MFPTLLHISVVNCWHLQFSRWPVISSYGYTPLVPLWSPYHDGQPPDGANGLFFSFMITLWYVWFIRGTTIPIPTCSLMILSYCTSTSGHYLSLFVTNWEVSSYLIDNRQVCVWKDLSKVEVPPLPCIDLFNYWEILSPPWIDPVVPSLILQMIGIANTVNFQYDC